jgi:hypothetical protein
MMAHPLHGARLKVVRAQQHLDALNDELGRYLNRHPYEFPVQVEGNSKVTLTSAVIREHPPDILSAIFGDCIGNLRAALDYIAWQLATKYAGRPLTDREARGVYFPICDRSNLWPPNTATHLMNPCGVPAPTIGEIEKVQPYQAGYQPIGFLSQLVSIDKHRLPLMTIGNAQTLSCQATLPGGWVMSGTPGASITFGAGVPSGPAAPPVEVQMEGKAAVYVTLQDASMPQGPVDLLLGQMLKCVSDVLSRFEPLV